MELSWNDDPSLFNRNYIDLFPGERYEFILRASDYTPAQSSKIKFRSLIDTR
jgi:hypothetical protein